jgi:hypothetical protein
MANSLEELLMTEISRRNTDLVSDLILKKPELFDNLMVIFLENQEPVSRRAAWIADTCSEKEPVLLDPWIGKIIDSLPSFSHDGLKRHSLRMLSRSVLPSNRLGKLISLCFDWLTSPKESVAVKVFCMEILYRVSQNEPDIRQELIDSIEWRMSEESPGFRTRGLKILSKLARELRDLHS